MIVALLVGAFLVLRHRGKNSGPDTLPRPNELLQARVTVNDLIHPIKKTHRRVTERISYWGPSLLANGGQTGTSINVSDSTATSSHTLPSIVVTSTARVEQSTTPNSNVIESGEGTASPLRSTQLSGTEPDNPTVERIDIMAERFASAHRFAQHDGWMTPPPEYAQDEQM